MIELGLDTHVTNRFEQPYGAQTGDVSGVFGYVEADPDVALSAEIIDFVGLNLA